MTSACCRPCLWARASSASRTRGRQAALSPRCSGRQKIQNHHRGAVPHHLRGLHQPPASRPVRPVLHHDLRLGRRALRGCQTVRGQTGAFFCEGYGLSETAPILTVNPPPRSSAASGRWGYPLPGNRHQDRGHRNRAHGNAPGRRRRIAGSGPQIMQGYWNGAKTNEAAFREINGPRYLLTGDTRPHRRGGVMSSSPPAKRSWCWSADSTSIRARSGR